MIPRRKGEKGGRGKGGGRPGLDREAGSADGAPGSRLRVVARPWEEWGSVELAVEVEEAAQVGAGEALPLGADAVLGPDEGRAEAGSGADPLIEVVRGIAPGHGVVPRGA